MSSLLLSLVLVIYIGIEIMFILFIVNTFYLYPILQEIK